MYNAKGMIDLSKKDGHSMYDRFEIIRAVVRQAINAETKESGLKYLGEVYLNMALMKIAMYMDDLPTEPYHIVDDYKKFLTFGMDAVEYIKLIHMNFELKPEALEREVGRMIELNFKEYVKNHDSK